MDEPRHLRAEEVRVGTLVGLWNGSRVDTVEVIEDRGNVGMGGRRMFRVRVGPFDSDGLDFDAPLDWIVEPAPPSRPARRSRTRRPAGKAG
jgi:hypothetical protein